MSASDLDCLSQFSKVTHLELGDCVPSAGPGAAAAFSLRPFVEMRQLTSLRLERAQLGVELSELRFIKSLQSLELIDVQLKEGFGDGLVKMVSLKKLLIIPVYKNEVRKSSHSTKLGTLILFFTILLPLQVAAINSEIVDSAVAMSGLGHFFLGLTNEWLESMNSMVGVGGDSAASGSGAEGGAGAGGGTPGAAAGSGLGAGTPAAAVVAAVPKDSFPIQVNGACEMYSLAKLFKTLSVAMPNTKVKILKMSKQATTKQFLSQLTRS